MKAVSFTVPGPCKAHARGRAALGGRARMGERDIQVARSVVRRLRDGGTVEVTPRRIDFFERFLADAVRGHGRPFVYPEKESAKYEKVVAQYANNAMVRAEIYKPMEGQLIATIMVFRLIPKNTPKWLRALMLDGVLRPIIKPDIDNLEKGILDAMNGIVYKDDCQIVGWGPGHGKWYDDGDGVRVEVSVEEMYTPSRQEKS